MGVQVLDPSMNRHWRYELYAIYLLGLPLLHPVRPDMDTATCIYRADLGLLLEYCHRIIHWRLESNSFADLAY